MENIWKICLGKSLQAPSVVGQKLKKFEVKEENRRNTAFFLLNPVFEKISVISGRKVARGVSKLPQENSAQFWTKRVDTRVKTSKSGVPWFFDEIYTVCAFHQKRIMERRISTIWPTGYFSSRNGRDLSKYRIGENNAAFRRFFLFDLKNCFHQNHTKRSLYVMNIFWSRKILLK